MSVALQSPQLRRLLVVVVGVLLSLCRLAIARILTSGQLVCSLKLSSALSPSLQLRLSRPPSRLPVATNSSRSNSGLGSSLSLPLSLFDSNTCRAKDYTLRAYFSMLLLVFSSLASLLELPYSILLQEKPALIHQTPSGD